MRGPVSALVLALAAPRVPAGYVAYDARSEFSLTPGASCAAGFLPITSSSQVCRDAAMILGYSSDTTGQLSSTSSQISTTSRPRGCFRGQDGQASTEHFYFNTGAGGSAQGAAGRRRGGGGGGQVALRLT